MKSKELKFWVGCPDCRRTIGVPSRFVIQYLERVLDEAQGRLEMAGEPEERRQRPTSRPERRTSAPARYAKKYPKREGA